MTYRIYQDRLVPLETFDPGAFVGDADCPQDLCDFILTLAAIYNDFKNLYVAQALLESGAPEEPPADTTAWGQYNAFRAHASRLHAGLVHELWELIEKGTIAREHRLFRTVIRQISREGHKAWGVLEAVSLQKRTNNALSKALLMMRNKVAFHYDAKEIARGYSEMFTKQPGKTPYISRGNSLVASRFYFADAAMQAYTFLRAPDSEAKAFLQGTSPLFRQVHVALYEIVTKFIQARGFAWRSP